MGVHVKEVTPLNPETISAETLNRLYLNKHRLFPKAKRNEFVHVVDDVCGLHAQAPQTPYLSLWSRVDDFENSMLEKALYVDKKLIKVWCMRGTLHVIRSDDLPIYNRALRRMWFEHHGRYMREPHYPSLEERKKDIYPAVLEALAEGALKRKDLNNKVRALLRDDSKPYQRLFSGWGGILKETAYEGLTVHAQPCGIEACFARLDKWLPRVDVNSVDEEEAQEKLLAKYLRGYGPATQQDFVLWSGLMAGDAQRAIQNAESRLLQVEVKDAKGRFLMLKEDAQTIDSVDVDEEPPVILLPRFDSILLGHKDRSRIIREEYKKRVFKPKVGDIAATILIDGRIVGTWRPTKTKAGLTITANLFEKISRGRLREVEQRAEELSRFLGAEKLRFVVAS